MDWYNTRELRQYYSRYEKLSRGDLTLGGLTLAFLAAILLAGLSGSQDLASIAVRSAVALSFAGGAVACLVGAVTWGKPANKVDEHRARNVVDFPGAVDVDPFDARSRAA